MLGESVFSGEPGFPFNGTGDDVFGGSGEAAVIVVMGGEEGADWHAFPDFWTLLSCVETLVKWSLLAPVDDDSSTVKGKELTE